MRPRLMRGLGYLARGPEDAVAFLRSIGAAGEPSLWITSRAHPVAPPGGEILRVTTLDGGPWTIDPKRLQNLRAGTAAFLDEHASGTIVVDCVDLLTLHNGVERTMRALEDLHEEVATRDAVLVVFVDPRTASPRMVAWLERELDALPKADGPAEPPRGLLA